MNHHHHHHHTIGMIRQIANLRVGGNEKKKLQNIKMLMVSQSERDIQRRQTTTYNQTNKKAHTMT